MVILCSSSGLMAQDPNDPGEPDTLYLTAGGLHSLTGDTLYVWPDSFPQDVIIYLNVWNDNDVYWFVAVFIDNCNGPPCNADLDLEKNNYSDSPKGFEGSRMEHIEHKVFKLETWPPTFYPYVTNVDHSEDPMPPGDGLLVTFTFTVFDTGRICLDTTYVPPGARTNFNSTTYANYCPFIKPRNFVIAKCDYSSADPNYDWNTDIVDVVYLINYLFRSGPRPCVIKSGDASCDGEVNVIDIVYLIGYLFKGGPAPGYCP